MELLAVADVIADGLRVLMAQPVLKVEDVDTLLVGSRRGGDPERFASDNEEGCIGVPFRPTFSLRPAVAGTSGTTC